MPSALRGFLKPVVSIQSGGLLPAVVLGLCCLLPGIGTAADLADKVSSYKLDNGLQLLVVPRHDVPTVSAYITFAVGSVNEGSCCHGVAHLLEHMRFKGTRTVGTRNFAAEKRIIEQIEQVAQKLRQANQPQQKKKLKKQLAQLQQKQRQYIIKDELSRIYSRHGATNFNAFTSRDMTSYMVSLPSNKLKVWARLEADRMRHPVLREFYTERQVILEERSRSYETDPRGMLYEHLIATAFQVHPYRHPTIGWRSDIEHLTKAETRQFLEDYYAPVNTVIALVGDVQPQQAHKLVKEAFGELAGGKPVPPVTSKEPQQRGQRRTVLRFEAQPRLALAFHKPTLPSRADYAFDLLDQILTGGKQSRLYRRLVLEEGLASEVYSYGAPGSRYPNLFVIEAMPRNGHAPKELEQVIEQELQRLRQTPVSQPELQRARKQLRMQHLRYMRDNGNLARLLTTYEVVADSWRYIVNYNEQLQQTTAEDIQQAAQQYLRTRNSTVVTLLPPDADSEKSGESASQEDSAS